MSSADTPADAPRDSAPGRFAGKVALITGASDKGIGGAIAERLAKDGASLGLLSRSQPKRLLKRLSRLQVDHVWHSTDITDEQQVRHTVDQLAERFESLDIVINNAGIETARPFDQFDSQEWQQLLDINLHGTIRVIQSTLDKLATPAVIINVASALALGGCPSFSIYSASKAGLVGLTQSLAWELAPRRIRVVAVAPGLVHTPMIHKHIEHLTPEVWKQVEACHPLGMGSPHDVASAVAFLASEDARWITGITLPLGWASSYPLPVEHFMG